VDWLAVLLVALVVVVIWRGPKTIPQIGAMLGRGVKAAREEANELRADKSDRGDADKPPTP
jgi:Sec-independent protein translocase protein TatA